MCGIAGVWTRSDETTVREMMDCLRHRGPDAQGVWARSHGVLGHRRLSIMDPAGGDQPILSADRNRAIVANGEVYNYPSLREALTAAGHRLRTGNDSESALHLFEDLGPDAVERLDGMFALAIADGDDLYLARDPVGIKPLYFADDDGRFAFASELKAFVGRARRVHEFPPGTWYDTRRGFHRFREIPDRQPEPLDEAECCRRLRETLSRAVAKRLMSDVPVGAFLSGGLDSSLICALARRHLDTLHTFSVGVAGSRDLAAARVVARHLDTVHHEYLLTPEEVRAKLPEILYHLESFDQDLVRSAIPCYFTSRLGREHVKVILTGEGADELFAGYTYCRGIADEDLLHRELRRSVCSLHNINLQRVDRLTMAHAIEGRVPFLDMEMIALGQEIPAELKLRLRPPHRPIEKYILRRAFEDLLPAEIVWRDKEQFDEGSGTVDLVADALEAFLPEAEADAYAAAHPDAQLRSAEECAYHKLLTEAYADPSVVLDNVARWSHRPPDVQSS